MLFPIFHCLSSLRKWVPQAYFYGNNLLSICCWFRNSRRLIDENGMILEFSYLLSLVEWMFNGRISFLLQKTDLFDKKNNIICQTMRNDEQEFFCINWLQHQATSFQLVRFHISILNIVFFLLDFSKILYEWWCALVNGTIKKE